MPANPKYLRVGMFLLATLLLGGPDVAAAKDDGQRWLQQAATRFEKGEYIEALEAYSRAAALSPDNAAARQGLRDAKLKIREEMGTVSAARLQALLTRLEKIDQERLKELSSQVAALETARLDAVARIGTLEQELAIAMAPPAVPARSVATAPASRRDPELEKLTRQVAAGNQARTDLESRLAAASRELATLQADSARLRQEGEQRLRELTAKVASLETEKAMASEAARGATQQVATLRQEIQALNGKLAALPEPTSPGPADQQELGRLKNTLAALETERAQLASELEVALKAAAAAKPSEAPGADAKTVAELRTAMAELTASRSKLETELAAARRTAGAVADKGELTTLQAALERLESDNLRLTTDLAAARQAAAATPTVDPKLQTRVERLEAALQASELEKRELLKQMDTWRGELLAAKKANRDQQWQALGKRAEAQASAIAKLSAATAEAQESCQTLLVSLDGKAPARRRNEAEKAALVSLGAMKSRLNRLGDALLAPVPPPAVAEPPPAPIVQAPATSPPAAPTIAPQVGQLAAELNTFDQSLGSLAAATSRLKANLDEGGDPNSAWAARLQAISGMHGQAGARIEQLKQQLRRLEAKISDES